MMPDFYDEQVYSEWDEAMILAREGIDKTKLINLLRKLHEPRNVPDLWFLADLIEGKFNNSTGRPRKTRIQKGLKERRAAETVAFLIHRKGMTVEEAICEAQRRLPMSESYIKKSYYNLYKDKSLLKKPIFKRDIKIFK